MLLKMKEAAAHGVWGVVTMAFLLIAVLKDTTIGINNPDTVFHLRVGEELVSGNWKPWDMGHFNRFDNADWVSTQWLPQWTLGMIEKVGGLQAISYFQSISALLLLWGVYFILRKHTYSLVAGLLTVGFFYSQGGWISLRPQIISFFLVLLVAHLFLKAYKTNAIPWLVLPIMWLWPNLHGMWIAGLVNIWAMSFAWALDKGFKTSRKIWLIPAISSLVVFLNPVGPKLIVGVFSIIGEGTGGWTEWGPPLYTDWRGMMAFALLGATLVFYLRKNKVNWFEASVLFLALGWGLWSLRSMPFSFLMFALMLSLLIGKELEPAKLKFWKKDFVAVTAIWLALGGVTLIATPMPTYNNWSFPAWARESMDELPPSTAVITSFNMGAYGLKSRPDLGIFIHGYADAQTPKEIARGMDFVNLRRGWPAKMKATGATIAFLEPKQQVTYALEQKGWTVVKETPALVQLEAPSDWLVPQEGDD